MSIGLALSGGGAKGAAHIGILQALKEEQINIEYISGTSSGSIVAALYACGYSPFNILSLFNIYCKNITDYDKFLPFKLFGTLFTGKISLSGLAKGKKLENILKGYFKEKNIEDINEVDMPLAIPSVDLYTGEIIYFLNRDINSFQKRENDDFDDLPTYINRGELASIVRASSSFPGVFEPKKIGSNILVDGGVRMNSPVSILKKMGADKVIVVSFDKNDNYLVKDLNIISVAMKSFDIMGHQLNNLEVESADCILKPRIYNVSLLDFKKTNLIATEGYNLVKKNIKEIKSSLQLE